MYAGLILTDVAHDLLSDLRATEDPLSALKVVAQYKRLLSSVEERSVTAARRAGHSWEDIAKVLGLTRQAVWSRYAGTVPPVGVADVRSRYPGLRRHMALRQAMADDLGVVVSERTARQLAVKVFTGKTGDADEEIRLAGVDPVSGTSATITSLLGDLQRRFLAQEPGEEPPPVPNES